MRALVASIWFAGCGAVVAAGCGAELGDGPSESADPSGDESPTSPTSPASCVRADIVFAVDNSGSMAKEQQALRDAFPAFSRALVDDVGIEDFRVGLVDGCARSAAFHTRGMNAPCNFAGGRTWIESSSPFLTAEFACVANVDSRDDDCNGNDDDEQPVSAAATALEPAFAAADRANAGFRRDDALLVVIAITDEDEQPIPAASAQSLHDRLAAQRRNGDVLFLGAGGSDDCDGPYGSARDADTLQDIANRFGSRGVFWDLCGGQLDRGLEQLVSAVARACE